MLADYLVTFHYLTLPCYRARQKRSGACLDRTRTGTRTGGMDGRREMGDERWEMGDGGIPPEGKVLYM